MQFVLDPDLLDEKYHQELIEDFQIYFKEQKFEKIGICESPILGKKGNKEYLFYYRSSS